ncbi:MAG: serine hydrolase [Saprospiraceae bacterium]|nr:serine hydrolase [Saprospiraceae bacterium]
MKHISLIFVMAWAWILPGTYAQLDTEALAELDAYVNQACEDWRVPGLSMTVVQDGDVVYQTNYGVRAVGGQEVNAQTIFCIGSTTKAMTAMAMAMLVDDGLLSWDDMVVDHLPDFQLYDPHITREMRVRDLFTHNLGIGNADLLWTTLELPSDEILQRMRYLEPSYTLRGGYTYQNIMYLAAGEIIERISGSSWASFIDRRIFQPLGMDRSYPTRAASLTERNRSTPHFVVDGKIQVITDLDADQIAPAGAVWSCIEDMAKWVQFLLNDGMVNGERLVSARNFAELFTPQIIIPKEMFYPTHRHTNPHWTTYGLGWFQHDYQGRVVQFHTGSLPGTIAIIGLIPEEELGVYVLSNLDHTEVRHALMYKVFDLAAGHMNGPDWSALFQDMYEGIRTRRDTRNAQRAQRRLAGTTPRLDLESYAGDYYHDYLGTVSVTADDGRLTMFLGTRSLPLEHWQHDTFRWKLASWSGDLFVSFEIDAEGRLSMSLFGRDLRKITD